MRVILTHQAKARNGRDTFVVDSVVSEFNGNTEQQSAISIVDYQEPKKKISSIKYLVPNCSKSLSIQVGKKTKSIYVSSHFLSQDELGRLIPFRFWMKDSTSPISVRHNLEEYSRMVNMELNPADASAIEICLSLYPKMKVGIIAICTLLFLIFFKVLLKNIL
ncbi:MAG: hypothetical protein SPL12_09180 [Bacteroidales bacterium]|nr:hypothetical protein [Bacteroidales bacterium]